MKEFILCAANYYDDGIEHTHAFVLRKVKIIFYYHIYGLILQECQLKLELLNLVTGTSYLS